ncbi:MAG: hypothetical protein ACE5F5_11410 [Acidimicrobiia bacterium]
MAVLAAVVAAMTVLRVGITVADLDLWGHVRFGQDKIRFGGYLSTDTYSYVTEGQRWFNHEWLSEVVMAAVYQARGAYGLAALKAAIAVGVVAFLFWWLVRDGLHPVRVAVVMLVGVVVLIPTLGTFRPQLFTLVAFTALVAVIRKVEGGDRRWLLALPLLFAMWVNLHGGVLAGIAVLGTWALLYVFTVRDRTRWWPVAGLLGSVLALGLNPNGLAHLLFLVRTTTVDRPEIVEWRPVDLTSGVGLAYIGLAVAVLAALWVDRRNLQVRFALPLIALVVAPLLAMRHLQVMVPAAVVLGGTHLAVLGTKQKPERGSVPKAPVLISAALVLAGYLSWSYIDRPEGCIRIKPAQFEFPVRAVDALKRSGVEGRAVVPFNWGEYVIWHLGPRVQVSIDGRRETVYSPEVLAANLDFEAGRGEWDRVFDFGVPDLVLLPAGSGGAALMRLENDWVLAYEDALAAVFVRAGSELPLTGDPGLPVDGDGLCFPG